MAFRDIIEKYGYVYYMVTKNILKHSTTPVKSQLFWTVSTEDSFYKLLDDPENTFYYKVFLDPDDQEIALVDEGVFHTTSLFIENGSNIISGFHLWDWGQFCLHAIDHNRSLIRYIRSKDQSIFNHLITTRPFMILEINEIYKTHLKWKIEVLKMHPDLMEKYGQLNGPEFHNMILDSLPVDNIKYIKNPDRQVLQKALKKIFQAGRPDLLSGFKVIDTDLILPYIKKNPELVLKIKEPTFTLYEEALLSGGPLMMLSFPLRVNLRLIMGHCCFA